MENEQELNRQVDRGRKVKEMTETEGWSKFVLPILETQTKLAIDGFVNAKTLEEFLMQQATVKSVNLVLRAVEDAITTGEQAAEEIEKRKESKPEQG